VRTIDLGANHQMPPEVRLRDTVREYGFLGVVVDTTNLEGSIWTWWCENGKFHVEKTATIRPSLRPKICCRVVAGFWRDRRCWGTGRRVSTTSRKPKLAPCRGIARRAPPERQRIRRAAGVARRTRHNFQRQNPSDRHPRRSSGGQILAPIARQGRAEGHGSARSRSSWPSCTAPIV
jgi:hypothetical protein